MKPILIFGLLLVGWLILLRRDTWTGFYYPNATSIGGAYERQSFASVSECRDWALARPDVSSGVADYECGLNCRFDGLLSMYRCKETTK